MKPHAWKPASVKLDHKGRRQQLSANASTSTRAERRAKVSHEQITAAKMALDSARRLGDLLKIDLAENTLNDLLDRYHTYHTNRRDK